ncbi:MAG: 7-cyano-7-deazaguanine synthase [Deltaproteobacteria bacterium]|nr:7-cyano-7-deazaguanine synthase [Deltaproteobacteria bacterium]
MNRKAVALLSGGLDSTLAVKVILEQGVEIVALNFTSTFCTCSCRGSVCSNEAARVAKEFGVPIKVLQKGLDYIEVVRNPKYGYGQGINPCVDCRIYMHKLAKKCLLTDKIFSKRVKDLLENKKDVTMKDLQLLKAGRHFRLNKDVKIIIGRDEADNKQIKNLAQADDTLIEPLDFIGPTGLICGISKNGTHTLAGKMVLRYAGEKAAGKKLLKLSMNGETSTFEADSPADDEILKGMMI